MPRPKRTKIASSINASRLAKPALVPKSKLAKSTAQYGASDEDEGNNGTMEDVRSRVRKSIHLNRESAAALARLEKRRNAAMGRLNAAIDSSDTTKSAVPRAASIQSMSSSPPVEFGRKERPAAENATLSTSNFKRRSRQPSILGRQASSARSSSVDLNLAEDSSMANMNLKEGSLHPHGNASRRSRQQTILGRPPSRARSSSMAIGMQWTPAPADSVSRPGQLRRRARQPSILGTSRKDQSKRDGVDKAAENDEDDFNPEDESTPLNNSRGRAVGQSSQSISSALNSRKRKLSSLQPQNSPPLRPGNRDVASSIQGDASPSQQHAPDSTPEPLSETMAPPQSSSPSLPSTWVQPRSRRMNAPVLSISTRRQPSRKVHLPSNESPPSSPPSLTHSPNHLGTTKRQTKPKQQSAGVSTTQLQALLPRRRHRATRDPYDIESSGGELDISGLASDEDELANLAVRPGRNAHLPSVIPARRVSNLKPRTKSTPTTKVTTVNDSAGTKKTYSSRRTSSEKENDVAENEAGEDEDGDADDSLGPIAYSEPESSQDLEERVGTELKKAKRKFEVVDKWELEFEDVTASSSSPWDAR